MGMKAHVRSTSGRRRWSGYCSWRESATWGVLWRLWVLIRTSLWRPPELYGRATRHRSSPSTTPSWQWMHASLLGPFSSWEELLSITVIDGWPRLSSMMELKSKKELQYKIFDYFMSRLVKTHPCMKPASIKLPKNRLYHLFHPIPGDMRCLNILNILMVIEWVVYHSIV